MYRNIFIIAVIFATYSFIIPKNALATDALEPASAWKIKSINLSDGLAPYCSMRNYFPAANISLIISQDTDKNISFAIDFMEKLLPENMQYSMNIKITPNKLNKTVIASSATSSIIVAQMGENSSFINNIAKGETLDVTLPQANFQFFLDGTLKAVKKLRKCLSKLKKTKNKIVDNTKIIEIPEQSINVEKSINNELQKQEPVTTTVNNNIASKINNNWEKIIKNALHIDNIDTSNEDKGVYIWQKDNLYGNAQIFEWEMGKTFTEMIDAYVASTKKRCLNNFAAHTGKKLTLAGGHVYATGNIACIGQDTDNAAALFFHGIGNKFLVISHEGSSEELETALKIRDDISKYFLAKDAKLSMEN